MADTDRAVLVYFHRDEDTPQAVDALAYAKFASDKYEWIAKYEALNGEPPTPERIDRWIAELPDSRLDDIQKIALAFFEQTVAAFVTEAQDHSYKAGKQDAIVAQVERATSFWRNLPGNITVGVVSSFAFALLLVLASVIFAKDPSPIALYQKLVAPPASPVQ